MGMGISHTNVYVWVLLWLLNKGFFEGPRFVLFRVWGLGFRAPLWGILTQTIATTMPVQILGTLWEKGALL